jgi:DtxR family transcriptional regulator, Mn-dependent transcriptional regulator
VETWKAFENNEITHSGAHYLMAIHDLTDEHGYARVSDIARHLEVTRGSASLALKALREKGLVEQDENRFLRLCENGERIAHAVRSQRQVVQTFFREVLHVEAHQAEEDACKIEHLISTESGGRLLSFIKYLMEANPDTRALLRMFWSDNYICKDQDDCQVCENECLARQWTQAVTNTQPE